MRETEWAKLVASKLNDDLLGVQVEAGKRLIYANEIAEYRETETIYNEMAYETDLLIYEVAADQSWKPRVVIETKTERITTHDAITYSQKSATHKYVHPFLRNGIFLGHMGTQTLPVRLFRHGAHFDFMLSWKGFEPLEYEWEQLITILTKEIEASKQLEEMIFNSRRRQRERYFSLHRPLILKADQ